MNVKKARAIAQERSYTRETLEETIEDLCKEVERLQSIIRDLERGKR